MNKKFEDYLLGLPLTTGELYKAMGTVHSDTIIHTIIDGKKYMLNRSALERDENGNPIINVNENTIILLR